MEPFKFIRLFRNAPVIIVTLLLLFISFPELFSQQYDLSGIITDIAEQLAEDESDPEAVQVFADRLHDLSDDPVRLNSCDEQDLSRLFFLSDFQVRILLDYIRTYGKILTPYEIPGIPGFNKATAEMMIPFVSFSGEDRDSGSNGNGGWRSTMLTNISYSSPSDTGMIGPPVKTLLRYRLSSGGLSAGFTAERDAGERLPGSKHPVPDFFSAHLSYTGEGIIKRVIIGDFSARFGYGTNINTGFRTALSVIAPVNLRGNDEIKGYTSTDENNFFRGAATMLSFKNFGLAAFYSRNRCDATTGYGTDSSEICIENLYRSGLHNTNSLLQKKDKYTETNFGLDLTYNSDNIRIGLLASATGLSVPLTVSSGKPGDLYDFTGDFNRICTFYYKSLVKKILFTGEFSTGSSRSFALVQGVAVRPSDRLTVSILYRNYDNGYFSFHGRGPGISTTSAEKGLTGSFTYEAAKHLFISAGCDVHRFPWLAYRNSAPSSGIRQELRIKLIQGEDLTLESSFHYRKTMTDKKREPGIPEQVSTVARIFRTSLKYSPGPGFTIGTRVDYKFTSPSSGKGMMMLQDITFRPASLPLTLWFRYCIFGTDDWDSRLYAWENDLIYSFSIPALSGRGSRSYLMASWKAGKTAELRVKYAVTIPEGQYRSSGNRQDIRMQLTYRF